MGTRWELDLSTLLLSTSQLANETYAELIVVNNDLNMTLPASSTLEDPYQAVRVITWRIHVSRTDFSEDSILSVYSGDSSLNGQRISSLSGKETLKLSTMPSSTPFTETEEYQSTYGSQISQLNDPIIFEVRVLNPRSTLAFDSRSSNGLHFVASYTYSFNCPEGLELATNDDTDTTTSTSSTSTINTNDSCVEPVIGTGKSVLIMLLGIGGGLVAFAFIWLMYERYQRQKANNLLRSASMRSGGSSSSSSSSGTSDEDLESESGRLYKEFRRIAYRRFVKEIVFELISLTSECVSTILNWVVVGEVLSRGTTSLSSLSVGYIIVVIISTFAVGANAVSRITLLMLLKGQIELEASYHTRVASMTNEAATKDADDLIETQGLKTEGEVRKTIEEVNRRLWRMKIGVLAMILHGLPFLILNLVTLYDENETPNIRSRSAVTVQVSLLMSILTIGMKIQDLKDYPNQERLLAQSQLQLVQLRLEALHANLARKKGGKATSGAAVGSGASSVSGSRLRAAPLNDEVVSSEPISTEDAILEMEQPPPPPSPPRYEQQDGMEMATL